MSLLPCRYAYTNDVSHVTSPSLECEKGCEFSYSLLSFTVRGRYHPAKASTLDKQAPQKGNHAMHAASVIVESDADQKG